MSVDESWTTRRLVRARDDLAGQLGLLADFTPGTVQETWSKCGKPSCHCAKEGDPGHGPRLLWVRYENGRTRSRTVPALSAEVFRQQVERSEVFTAKVSEITRINAILADRGLTGRAGPSRSRSVPGPAGEKGGPVSKPSAPKTKN